MFPKSYDWTKPQDPDDVDTCDTPGAQVQVPIQDTLDDYTRALVASGESSEKSTAQKQRQNKNQEDDMILSLSNEFSPLLEPGADTLIYIGPPPRAQNQSWSEYRYIKHRFQALHRIKSQTLKNLGSSTFDKLLGPKSERTRRKFGKDGLLTGIILDNIRYFVDLRPPEEGDEAVELITDLTCSRGILNWHKAHGKYLIARTLICGRDDFVSVLDQFRMEEATKEDDLKKTQLPVNPEAEYSALRHRSAIERVLQAIAHNDPKLDSAPKMWTYFQVAKHLDVAKHERVNGWITKWLYSHPNSHFIQCNPEVVYRIGMGTMLTNIVCDGYSILAGEKALLDTSNPSLRTHIQTSFHGRPLEILDDDERNRIDHAATSLHARMKLKLNYLVDDNMDWLKQSIEFTKLRDLTPQNDNERKLLIQSEKMIKDYVRGRILWAMARDYKCDHPDFDQTLRAAREFHPGLPESFHEVYGELNEEQRILTRTMWIALHTEKLEEGRINTWTPFEGQGGVQYLRHKLSPTSSHTTLGQLMIDREVREPGTGIVEMSYTKLSAFIDHVVRTLVRHELQVPQIDTTCVQPKPHLQPIASNSRAQYSDFRDPQAESSAAGEKHHLFEFELEDQPLDMTMHSIARSGLEKRQRRMNDLVASDRDEVYIAAVGTDEHLNTTLPLRGTKVDINEQEIAAGRTNQDTRTLQEAALVFGPMNDIQGETTSETDKLAFDDYTRFVAESNNYESWISWTGDFYINVKLPHTLAINTAILDHKIWFVKPNPFARSETVTSNTHDGREYWRATTCQLYCKLPDGRVDIVHEYLRATPSLAEAASRITNTVELKIYEVAYNAYARELAVQLSLPYWTDLNGEMWLRKTPATADADAKADVSVWEPATRVFYASNNKTSRFENGVKVEYWRAPSNHLFRRIAGHTSLFTEGRDELAPYNSGSILAAPLKILSNSMQRSYAPPARFMDRANLPPAAQTDSLRPKSLLPRPSPLKETASEVTSYGWNCINLQMMMIQFSNILSRYCEDILHPPHIFHGVDPIPRNLMDTLMCLSDDEWKYLPLWAGGCDDGTGGVFDEADVPNLEAGGFRGGKRGLGSGKESSGDSIDSDSFTDIASDAVSTVGRASKLATDGTDTVKSFDTASSADGFMMQDELWKEILDMKVVQDQSVPTSQKDEVTVVGAESDVHGQMFGDIDSDDDVHGAVGASDREEDEDIDFVDDEDLP